jgi:hypothetical protein
MTAHAINGRNSRNGKGVALANDILNHLFEAYKSSFAIRLCTSKKAGARRFSDH